MIIILYYISIENINNNIEGDSYDKDYKNENEINT